MTIFLLGILVGLGCGDLAMAAETDPAASADSPAEILVVGQQEHYRGDVAIKDTPQAVQILSGKQLEELGATRLDEVVDLVAGAAHENNFGGLWDSFAIRGFAGDENLPSGYLVNGFNGGRGFDGPRDAANVERIEVLKGPSSALFGRGEPGGIVNIVTKKPLFDEAGSVTAAAGSFKHYRADVDYTGPITEAVALRLIGAYENDGSYRDAETTEKYVITPSAIARLDEATSLSYELYDVRQRAPFDRGVVAVAGVLGAIPISRFLGEPGNGPITTSGISNQLELEHKFGPDWVLLAGFGSLQTWLKGFGEDPELTVSRNPFFIDGATLSRRRLYRDYSSSDLVPRAELSGRLAIGGLVNHLLAGVDFEDFHLGQAAWRYRPPVYKSGTSLLQLNAVNIYDPIYGNLPPVALFTNKIEIDKSYGAYLHDQIDLSEQWRIRIGGRFDQFHQSLTDRIVFSVGHQDVTKISPMIGMIYEVTPDMSLYASYGGGFRPNSGFDANGAAFKPETTTAWEVGAKLQTIDNAINGTLALFTMNKTNVLSADPFNAGFSITAGNAESRGVELDLSARLPLGARLDLGYAYTDAAFTNAILDPDFGRPLPAGASLINVPKNSGNIVMVRDFAVLDRTLTLGVGANYVGRRLGETGTSFYLPSYTLVKFLAAYQLDQRIKLLLTVNNALGQIYYPESYSRLWVTPGAPREATFRITYRF